MRYVAGPAGEPTVTITKAGPVVWQGVVTKVLRLHWDDQAGVEQGWHVQVLRPDADGHLVAVYSVKVAYPLYPVEVTGFGRHQQTELLAALAAAYPDVEIEAEQQAENEAEQQAVGGQTGAPDGQRLELGYQRGAKGFGLWA